MNHLTTKCLVLNRTNFAEADRIISVLTRDLGKLNLIVRGARKPASRLAGGIELFSVSDISLIKGRSDLATLISARPNEQFPYISSHLDRIELGYYLLKLIDQVTEENAEPDYFKLLEAGLRSLNQPAIKPEVVKAWFEAQVIKLSGRQPDLEHGLAGQSLRASQKYDFDLDKMGLKSSPLGKYSQRHIKLLRLLFSGPGPSQLSRIEQVDQLSKDIEGSLEAMISQFIRL